jgi:hypothetical protein
MTAVAVRRTVLAVCVVGIAGMIVSSVLDRNGAAITFGLVTAAAVVCSMVATAVSSAGTVAGAAGDAAPLVVDEAQAARVEEMVGALVAAGAEEEAVRALVRESVSLGRSASRAPSPREVDAPK